MQKPTSPEAHIRELYATAWEAYLALLPPGAHWVAPHLVVTEVAVEGNWVAVRTAKPGTLDLFEVVDGQVRQYLNHPDPDPTLSLPRVWAALGANRC